MTPKIYKLTVYSCFAGIFSQAIITNLTAILFIPLKGLYGLRYIDLGILVFINFSAQICADILFSGVIDEVGFKKLVLPACFIAFLGMILLGLTPFLFESNIFMGLCISTVIFAFASGLLEVLLSPIISHIPSTGSFSPLMSLLHSFYAWGQAITIIVASIYLFVFPHAYWFIIAFILSIVPLCALIMFCFSPLPRTTPKHKRTNIKKLFLSSFFMLALFAIMFGGATEVVMNQWVSTFLTESLGFSKLYADLFGMCGFAIMLGVGRTLYGIFGTKFDIKRIVLYGSFFSAICYLVAATSPFNILNIVACVLTGLFASLLWPGVIAMASEKHPFSGAWMFAILALAGDLGAAMGPFITGLVTDTFLHCQLTTVFMRIYNQTTTSIAMRIGLLVSIVFPLLTFICHFYIRKQYVNKKL